MANGITAGRFSSWLDDTRTVLARERDAAVPCGECNACCRSSQFVHVRPEEARTLARIPRQLLFPAPGLPKGNVLLGYDEHGRCPMLVGAHCSIYADRPLACRTYDCRIFAATGIAAGGGDHPVAQQAVRWRFGSQQAPDDEALRAVRAAARFLGAHGACFPAGFLPRNPSQLAILALEVYDVFMGRNDEPASPAEHQALADEIVAAHATFRRGEGAV